MPIYVSMISYQFCDVNVIVLQKHTFEAFHKSSTFKYMAYCNKQGGLVGKVVVTVSSTQSHNNSTEHPPYNVRL